MLKCDNRRHTICFLNWSCHGLAAVKNKCAYI